MALPEQHPDGTPEERLKALALELPPFPKPAVSAYIPYAVVGDLMYISGQLPTAADGVISKGKITDSNTGPDYADIKHGKHAASLCALNILSILKHTLGSLDKVVRIVKLYAMVNCTGDFKEPQTVANGCSEVLINVFGEAGRSTRSAVGHATLPFGASVEVEAIVQIEPNSKL